MDVNHYPFRSYRDTAIFQHNNDRPNKKGDLRRRIRNGNSASLLLSIFMRAGCDI